MTVRARTLLLAATLAGCAAGEADRAPLTELTGSLDPLRGWFLEHAGTPRVLLLLSPI